LSNVSIGKNAFHVVFFKYLETEFSDLRLVLSRWVTYFEYRALYFYTICAFRHRAPVSAVSWWQQVQNKYGYLGCSQIT